MATKKAEKEEKANPVTDVIPAPPASKDPRVPTNRARVSGTLAKPIYLIHDGKFEGVQIPAVTREYVETDPDAKNFGAVVEEEVIPAQEISGTLPKDSRFGRRKIGVAHMITDKAEAESLKRRGFREATEAEIEKSTKTLDVSARNDALAAQARVEAQQKLRRMAAGPIRRRTEDEE